MTKIILASLTLTIALASAHSDIVQRRWTLPALTPVVETYDDTPDPFAANDEFKSIESFNEDQLVLWLKASGVSFPPDSSARYLNESGTLIIRNTPHNLELVDHLLTNKFPVQISLQLMKRFLAETENKPIDDSRPSSADTLAKLSGRSRALWPKLPTWICNSPPSLMRASKESSTSAGTASSKCFPEVSKQPGPTLTA